MKRILILLFLMFFLFSGFNFAQESKESKNYEPVPEAKAEYVTKTYTLKHITPREAIDALRLYFRRDSHHRNSRMLTVQILRENVAEFEKLLKKLDAAKRNIYFRIYTVIASNEQRGDGITNKSLKKVLEEVKKVLSFKSYSLDGASITTIREGKDGFLSLLSKQDGLSLGLDNVCVKGDVPGKRTIEIGGITLKQYNVKLIETETSFKENGYLIAGVSKIGKNGDALILVLNAEIR
ncbi:MAG: hypothetical protein KAW12_05665 [Candidatus Aminicenantes bacterium]|nr:hypothetical protein [Candidatus Aminicenantes bacterium]